MIWLLFMLVYSSSDNASGRPVSVMSGLTCIPTRAVAPFPKDFKNDFHFVEEGSVMYFQCHAYGSGPNPNATQIQWKDVEFHTFKTLDRFVAEFDMLARAEDNGVDYTCVLSHPDEGVMDECNHRYTVFYPPFNLTISPDPGGFHMLEVESGETISCEASREGFPACEYFWFKVGEEENIHWGKSLTIGPNIMKDLYADEFVRWACMALNRYLDGEHSLYEGVDLRWRSRPVSTEPPKTESTASPAATTPTATSASTVPTTTTQAPSSAQPSTQPIVNTVDPTAARQRFLHAIRARAFMIAGIVVGVLMLCLLLALTARYATINHRIKPEIFTETANGSSISLDDLRECYSRSELVEADGLAAASEEAEVVSTGLNAVSTV